MLLPPTGYGLFQLQRKAASRTNESYSVVWLRVKLVEAILLENRCVNGLVHRLYPPAASPALMKNNGFIPEGRGPQVTPPLLLLLPLPVYSDSAGKPTDDWAGSHLASAHLV